MQIATSKTIVQCYSLSDIHADTEKNQSWIENHGIQLQEQDELNPDYRVNHLFRVLIIPGDVGSEVDKIERVLNSLHPHYDMISYLPGNHEAWLRGDKYKQESLFEEDGRPWDSVKKLQEIYQGLSKFPKVKFGPIKITFPHHHHQEAKLRHVLIQPLHAWYHKSWDTEPEITNELYLRAEAALPFVRKWSDYSLCRWPIEHTIGTSKECTPALAEAFSLFNEDHLHALPVNEEELSNEHLGSKYISEAGTRTR
jgi:hypothetical protein